MALCRASRMKQENSKEPWSAKIVRHVFVDESVRRDGLYRLTAVAVPVSELAVVSRALRSRAPDGATRMHFSSESDKRRRATLRSLSKLPIEAVSIIGPYPVRSSEEVARNLCIAELVLLSTGRVSNLTFDTRAQIGTKLIVLPSVERC